MTKKYTDKYPHLERTLTIAGVILIVLTIVATLFSAWNNRSFISDPLSVIYYFRYLLVLGGGYGIGYIFSRVHQSNKSHDVFLFSGVSYSLLAIVTFFFLDVLRVLQRNLFGDPTYPWGRILFEGSPFIVLAAVVIIAATLRSHIFAKTSGCIFKWLFILLFVVQQASMNVFVDSISTHAQFSYNLLWIILLGIITMPLLVAAVAYALLGKVKQSLNRIFYSSVIGVLYGATSLVVWEFRTNPEVGATEAFGSVVTILVLALTVVLIWRARKTAK